MKHSCSILISHHLAKLAASEVDIDEVLKIFLALQADTDGLANLTSHSVSSNKSLTLDLDLLAVSVGCFDNHMFLAVSFHYAMFII